VQTFSGTLTAVAAAQALQDPKHSWIWVSLGAFILFASSVVRIWLGATQNYLQSDPNIPTQANPAVVTVTTTGPVPAADTSIKQP
jgi:hypothetical protein